MTHSSVRSGVGFTCQKTKLTYCLNTFQRSFAVPLSFSINMATRLRGTSCVCRNSGSGSHTIPRLSRCHHFRRPGYYYTPTVTLERTLTLQKSEVSSLGKAEVALAEKTEL